MENQKRAKVLFLCTHNSARSTKLVLCSQTQEINGIGAFLISKAQGSEAERLQVYRAVRDAIQQKIEDELL